jgi:acetyl-CoA/propionyl-CoA carboxylase carboxyl transferase subunit
MENEIKVQHSSTSDLKTMRESARLGGGQKRQEAQHAKGKLTARERIAKILDNGTFHEIDMFRTHHSTRFGMEKNHYPTDGVVTGWGKVDGRRIYIYAQDFTVMGGSLGENHGLKIAKVMDLAIENGAPIVGLNDSGGARIQEGVNSLAGCGEMFYRNVRASGIVPQITAILGPCAGAAVYSPALTDFIYIVKNTANMFITGPDVVRAVTHEDVDFETLGGAQVHVNKSGVAHFIADDEDQLLNNIRWLLSYLPLNNLSQPPFIPPADDSDRETKRLEKIVPLDPQTPYDIHEVIQEIADDGEFLEIQENYAQNIIIGFARMDGHPVGIIANQPLVLAGVIDINSSDKAARFIRFCDAFHIPLLTLIDTPGFLPGVDQEHNGIIRHGAKMIFAYSEASVPKVSLILRKAYGGAYIVMSSKHLGGDINFAWPNVEIAVMGPESAVNIIYKRELAASQEPDVLRHQLIDQYRSQITNPFIAAANGYLDDIILPSETRTLIIDALDTLRNKRQKTPGRKHGNIPL